MAAESHVDRSISDPINFVQTNVIGTVNLLNSFNSIWSNNFENKIFYHVSTDEVYGTLGETGLFTEKTKYDPRSPYSTSKASSIILLELMARRIIYLTRFQIVQTTMVNINFPKS